MFILGLAIGVVVGGLGAIGYFTYTGSTLIFKKKKAGA